MQFRDTRNPNCFFLFPRCGLELSQRSVSFKSQSPLKFQIQMCFVVIPMDVQVWLLRSTWCTVTMKSNNNILLHINEYLNEGSTYPSVCMLSRFWVSATTWNVACQAPSMDFSRQEYRSGLPFPPSSRSLPNPEIEPASLVSAALAGRFFTTEPPEKSLLYMWTIAFSRRKYSIFYTMYFNIVFMHVHRRIKKYTTEEWHCFVGFRSNGIILLFVFTSLS